MEDFRYFLITKTIPGNLFISLTSITTNMNPQIIKLTDAAPTRRIPADWALSVFTNQNLYKMWTKGYFVFKDTDKLVEMAKKENLYWGEDLDFTPVHEQRLAHILDVLMTSTSKKEIESLVTLEGTMVVAQVAQEHAQDLKAGVLELVERLTNKQLQVD